VRPPMRPVEREGKQKSLVTAGLLVAPPAGALFELVDSIRIELTTSSMPLRRSTN
jgi:hypothetical protein